MLFTPRRKRNSVRGQILFLASSKDQDWSRKTPGTLKKKNKIRNSAGVNGCSWPAISRPPTAVRGDSIKTIVEFCGWPNVEASNRRSLSGCGCISQSFISQRASALQQRNRQASSYPSTQRQHQRPRQSFQSHSILCRWSLLVASPHLDHGRNSRNDYTPRQVLQEQVSAFVTSDVTWANQK